MVNQWSGNISAQPILIIDWYRSDTDEFEHIAWMEVIKLLQNSFSDKDRVCVVIDSNLGKLESYNNRTIPIAEGMYLPENFTLIYATGDKKDEWCNKMMKACDKAATLRKETIRQNPKLCRKTEENEHLPPIGIISLNNIEGCLGEDHR